MAVWTVFYSPTSWLVLAIAGIIAYWFIDRRKYPPGPFSLPIVGTWAIFNDQGDDYIKVLTDMRKKYGPVYTVYLGARPWITISGYEACREALVTKAQWFSSRPAVRHSVETLNPKRLGLVEAAYDEPCIGRRKFSLAVLREFALGKQSLEDKIVTESAMMVESFKKAVATGKPFDAHNMIYSATSNIICAIMFGHRFDYDDKEFHRLMYLGDVFFYDYDDLMSLDDMPILRSLPSGKKKLEEHTQHMLEFKTFIMKQIEQHQKTRDPENPRDFIDAYLKEIDTGENPDFTIENLWILIFDFITAGTQTISKTVRWSLVYMANYPDVQSKIQAEIDDVVGKDEMPGLRHRPHMPYTDAAVHEILRLGSSAPTAIPHLATKTTTIAGHRIPEGSTILVNLFGINHEPHIWPEPDVCRPERFLDEQGQFVKRDNWVPFSMGRRHCLGKEMAMKELFLFISTLTQKFRFSPPPGVAKVSEEGVCGFTRGPTEYKISAKLRT